MYGEQKLMASQDFDVTSESNGEMAVSITDTHCFFCRGAV